jgi:DNA-directed RNA polymerase subunit RPC12/RpoP
MDISAESKRAVRELFGEGDTEEFSRIQELPDVDPFVAQALLDNGIDYIVDFLDLGQEELDAMGNISAEQIEILRKLIDDSVEILEEDEPSDGSMAAFDDTAAADDESADDEPETDEEIECPECEKKFLLNLDGFSGGTVNCPNCGAELELSYEKEEDQGE